MREPKSITATRTPETEILTKEALSLQIDATPVEVADKRIAEINARLTSLGIPSGGLLRMKSDIVAQDKVVEEKGRKLAERSKDLMNKTAVKNCCCVKEYDLVIAETTCRTTTINCLSEGDTVTATATDENGVPYEIEGEIDEVCTVNILGF